MNPRSLFTYRMPNPVRLPALLLGGLLLTPLSGAAEVILSDDFEGTKTGDTPTGWTILGTTVSVETEGQSVSAEGGRGMKLTPAGDSVGSSNPKAIRSFSQATPSKPLRVRFDFMYTKEHVINPSLQLLGVGGTGVNMIMKSFKENVTRVKQGNDWATLPGTELSKNVWYRYTVTADPVNDTFDLRIQSLSDSSLDETFSDLEFQNNLSSFTKIRFLFNTGKSKSGDTFFVDNVEIYPAP